MASMEFHEIANWFPLMDDAALNELAADIKANGLLEPIALLDGKILDGRNRYKACLIADVEPVFYDLDTTRFPDPVVYVLSRNLHRRDLTPSQRAMIGDRARDYYDRQAKERQAEQAKRNQPQSQKVETFPPLEKSKARDQAGAAVGVSGRTMDKAKKVREQGHKELTKAVESGRLDVTNAAKLAEFPKDVQETVLEDAQRQGWDGRQMITEANRLRGEDEEYTDAATVLTTRRHARSTVPSRFRHAVGVLHREIEIIKERNWLGVNRADARKMVMDIVKFIDKENTDE